MLPAKLRVKLLSEAAGYINVSQVVHRELSMEELVEVLLAVAGNNGERIAELLRAGTVSTGPLRYRWESFEVTPQELAPIMAALPHAEPGRPFEPQRAAYVRLRRGHEVIDFSRDSASRKPLFARQSLWDGLLKLFEQRVRYTDYSHADKADVFAVELDREALNQLELLASAAKAKSVAARLEHWKPERIDWLVPR